MSTDYSVVCDVCKKYIHFGYSNGCGGSLGHGLKNMVHHQKILNWIYDHASCSHSNGVRVMMDDYLFEYPDYACEDDE